ncbi:FRG domain-containing protein [Lelliottia amnigena]|uniref:FRG domain-containing protein n=1 Tax=Lelliottia amnigena TaxID=61646 RepID=UPI0021D9FF01|nr:FRG domain-containing protein [Lelliottia amnigena]MCU7782247.1 FRG domain-containing protein [Lelliottia amnigena]
MAKLNFELKIKRPRPPVQISSVAGFVEHVVKWTFAGYVPTAFRGQRYFGWRTLPKIFRADNNVYDSESLAVRDIVSLHPGEFEPDKTMFDRLVRMQHFGLPTRLLDVTTNPLVALWFATEPSTNADEHDGVVQAILVPQIRQRYYDSDRVSCMANLANLTKKQKSDLSIAAIDCNSIEEFNERPIVDTLVYNIGMEKSHFRKVVIADDLELPIYVKPKMSNKRIIAQSGAFLLWGMQISSGSGKNSFRQDRIWIHEDDKGDIRRDLQLLGINERTLFPEIDKSTKFITDLYGTGGKARGISTLL